MSGLPKSSGNGKGQRDGAHGKQEAGLLTYGVDESEVVGRVRTGCRMAGVAVVAGQVVFLLRAGHGQPMVDLRTNIADNGCLENNKGCHVLESLPLQGSCQGL